MSVVIEAENVAKLYRLGKVGTGTVSHDVKRWWANIRGLEDPYAKIAAVNDRTRSAGDNEYVWALKDISFQINQGDVVGIIGQNGAGKSTLLKILSRITAPSSGNIKIRGRIGSLLEVGTGFHPEMTGRENVYMNGTVLGMRRKQITQRFDEIVDFAGVAKYIDTPVKRYSSGMMVRLGFAVAAFLEPEILVVDEVLAVGDAEFQRKAIGKMKDVSTSTGRTVLFVSHNIGAMRMLCKNGIVLVNGEVAYKGSIDHALSEYLQSKQINNNAAYVEWHSTTEAPGDDELRLLNMSISDSKGVFKTDFESHENIFLNINFKVVNRIKGARFFLQLITDTGEVAFASTNHSIMTDFLEQGEYLTSCLIQGNLLNSGKYFLRIHCGIPGQKFIFEPRDFFFVNIFSSGQHGSIFNEKWPGVVAPKLNWTVKGKQ